QPPVDRLGPARAAADPGRVGDRPAARGAMADLSLCPAQPGGQVIVRPPSTCRCAWKTVWCAAAPVLKTIRYPASRPSCAATAPAAATRDTAASGVPAANSAAFG